MSDSPLEALRLSGKARSAMIGYGIAAYAFLMPRAPAAAGTDTPSAAGSLLRLLAIGVGLQLAVLAIRALASRYERAHGIPGALSPLALFLFEIGVDAVTVFTFALATFRGIAQYTSGV